MSANFCNECGAKLLPNARFCAKCRAPVENQPAMVQPQVPTAGICEKCGTPLLVGAVCCSKCGTYVARPPQVRKVKAKTGSFGKHRRTIATAKNKKAFTATLSVLLAVAVGIGVFDLRDSGIFNKKGSGENTDTDGTRLISADTGVSGDGTKITSSETGTVSAEDNQVTLCGVTLDVDTMMLADGEREVSVAVCEGGENDDGSHYDAYELEMGEHEDFYVPVKVTFPCEVSADTDVIVEHYVDGEWKPLISGIDEEQGTVSACFGSFSPARVSYYPVGTNPSLYKLVMDEDEPYMATIELRSNYWNILQRINPAEYSDEVTAFIDDPSNYAIEAPKLDQNMDAKAAYQAFTDANTMWTFCDPMINMGIETLPYSSQSRVVTFMIDHSGELSSAMNAIPFMAMAAQVGFDMSSGEKDSEKTASVNLYKNLINSSGSIYSLTTGYSHLGFSMAFLGVAIFGMELDAFIDAAKSEQAENVKAVFEAYYRDVEPFDDDHWYNVFYEAYWNNNGNSDAAMKEVKDAVDEYCQKFWTEVYNQDNDDILFAATSANYRKVFFNATPEQKKALTEQQKAKVWELIETKSMKKIQRFLRERLQESTREQLSKITYTYNQELIIRIQETVKNKGVDIAKYKGCTFCLASDGVPVADLHWNVPDTDDYNDGWDMDFECTVLGYLKIGMPNQVLVYKNEEDYNNSAEPLTTREFSINMKGDYVTTVELASSGTPDWLNGAWSEAYTFKEENNEDPFEDHNHAYKITIIDDHTLLWEVYYYLHPNHPDFAHGLDYAFEREYTYDPDTEKVLIPETNTGLIVGKVYDWSETSMASYSLGPVKIQRTPEKDTPIRGKERESARFTFEPEELTGEKESKNQGDLRYKRFEDEMVI